jgi:replicative DNA helicase
MNLDGILAKKLVMQGGLTQALNFGLTPAMLFNEGRDALSFMTEHFKKYGVMPEWATLVEAVPHMAQVDDDGLNESVEFLVDKAMWRFRGNLIQNGLKTATNFLSSSKPDDAIKVLVEAISKAEEASRDKLASTVELTSKKDIDEAWADYQHRKLLAGQPDGLPTPWPAITNATMGIHPGELWFIVARLKTGKTWALTLFAKEVWEAAKKPVLFVTMEMQPKRIRRRMHALAGKFPWGDFIKATLNPEVEKKYRTFLDGLDQMPRLTIVGSDRVSKPKDVELLIEETKPGLVIIDGVYFMSGQGEAGWEKLNDAVTALQRLTIKKNVPILASTQFAKKVGRDQDEAEAGDIGYAYGIAQAADVLMGIYRTPEMEEENKMKVELMETRDTPKVAIMSNWNLMTQDFHELQILSGDEFPMGGPLGGTPAVDAMSASVGADPSGPGVEY